MSGRKRHERGQSVVEFALVLPLMLIMLVAILDFARIYTTMMSVESAAREATDFGTTFGAGKWAVGSPAEATETEMRRRACIAASDLAGYADPDSDPATGNCTNPSFAVCLTSSVGGPCGPLDATAGCDDPLQTTPCRVTVTLTFNFRMLAPMGIDFLGVRLGLPDSITVQRDSTFAMTDIDLATGP